MNQPTSQGIGCVIGDVDLGANVRLGHHVILEDGAVLGDDVYVDTNTIVRGGRT